jgi:hypothetical protein
VPPSAITAGRTAVAATPDGHRSRGATLSNLGVVLRTRFERTHDQAALDEAVETIRAAVAATPDGHPCRAVRLVNLGSA